MKVLDSGQLIEGLQRNVETLERLDGEMREIVLTAERFVSLGESLKGQGGESLRMFYQECHLTFGSYFMFFVQDFLTACAGVFSALQALEPDPSGHIKEAFLESDIEHALNELSSTVSRLTSDANSIMDSVADIVSLPHLNDSDVQGGVRDARIHKDDTVTGLREFDYSQTNGLASIETALLHMDQWVTEIESMMAEGLAGVDFDADSWNGLEGVQALKTDLAAREAELLGIEEAEESANVSDSPSADAKDVGEAEKEEGGNKVLGFLKGAADFLFLDDAKTILDPDASLLDKGIAIAGFTPFGKALKVGKTGYKLVKNSPNASWATKAPTPKKPTRLEELRAKYGTIPPKELHQRINLRQSTRNELDRLKASGMTKKELGPAVAGVLDKKTGKTYYGINDPSGKVPSNLHPQLRDRIENMPPAIRDGYTKTAGKGSHAEVRALNEALQNNPNAKLDDFMVHVVNTKKLGPKMPQPGMPMPRCPHCEYITGGTKFFPEVIKNGR